MTLRVGHPLERQSRSGDELKLILFHSGRKIDDNGGKAYELGQTPDREWLLYVQSPREDRKAVEVKVPGFGETSVDVPRAGAFYHLREGHPTANRVGK